MLALRRCRPISSVIKSIASQDPLSKLYPTPIAVRHATKSASSRTKKTPSSVSENTKVKKEPSTRTKSRKVSDTILSSEPELKQHQEGVVLRPYQEECVAACLEALQDGITRIGVSSPTGSGKTTMLWVDCRLAVLTADACWSLIITFIFYQHFSHRKASSFGESAILLELYLYTSSWKSSFDHSSIHWTSFASSKDSQWYPSRPFSRDRTR